jgi:maltose O-acetyltransferase
VTALDVAPITIGADVLIGPGAQLLTPMHPLAADARRKGWQSGLPITVGDTVWIGGAAVICPGVTIGDNAVIGAGAVVTRDVPAGSVVVGNPHRLLR